MGAKLVPVLEGLSLITQQKQPSAVLLDLQKASEHIAQEDLVFLGLQDGGIPFFGAPCQESILKIVKAIGSEVQCTVTLAIGAVDVILVKTSEMYVVHANCIRVHVRRCWLLRGIIKRKA